MYCLVIQTGKRQGQQLILPARKEVLVGRSEECQVRLAAHGVSRRHCAVCRTDEGITVRDLGSRNGTLVNETPVGEETIMKPGDRLQIGPLIFRVAERADEKATTEQRAPQESPQQQVTSEEEVAGWLSETPDEAAEDGETGVLAKGRRDAGAAPQPAPPKEFESIADEAADIIRRWREMTGEAPTSEKSRESGS